MQVLGDWSVIGQKREDLLQQSQGATAEDVSDPETLVREAQFVKLCQSLVPGWRAVTHADVRFTVISGGLTNQLTKIAIRPDSELQHRLKRTSSLPRLPRCAEWRRSGRAARGADSRVRRGHGGVL